MTKTEAIKLIDDRMCFGRGKWSEHHMPIKDIYWEAGEMAIKALETEPQWIPCSEKLPEYGQGVLAYYEDGDMGVNHVIDEDDGEWFIDGVIAWLPLPEGYRGEQDDK